jgi:hypothetical protein
LRGLFARPESRYLELIRIKVIPVVVIKHGIEDLILEPAPQNII